MGNARAGRAQTNFGHRVLELEAVFGLVNRLGRSANQLHLVFIKHAVVPQIERAVERGLPAHSRQDRIRALFGDDFFHRLPGDGLDVGDIGRVRVGHDGGGVAVDQDDFVALLAQSLAGLHARIVKLARLPNDDGPSPDDQDAVNIFTFWHFF